MKNAILTILQVVDSNFHVDWAFLQVWIIFKQIISVLKKLRTNEQQKNVKLHVPFHIKLTVICFDYRPTPCISAYAPYGGGGAGITVEGYGSFGSGGYGYNNEESGCVLLEFWFKTKFFNELSSYLIRTMFSWLVYFTKSIWRQNQVTNYCNKVCCYWPSKVKYLFKGFETLVYSQTF